MGPDLKQEAIAVQGLVRNPIMLCLTTAGIMMETDLYTAVFFTLVVFSPRYVLRTAGSEFDLFLAGFDAVAKTINVQCLCKQ